MPKYDSQIATLKTQLAGVKNALVVLPAQITPDKLAAGLSLFLALEHSNIQISIVTEGTLLVAHTNLYGVGKVTNSMPVFGGGNFTLTLEGVVGPDGTVPSLDRLDWFPEGQNLNLVFHVLPGQKFEPKNIVPKYQATSSTSMIFVIGASNLAELGNIYLNNQQVFQGAQIINIDNSQVNASFGQTNIVDPAAPSISQIIGQVIFGVGLTIDSDIASNILTGIYSATNNMTSGINPETFMVVGQAMQSGGRIPGVTAAVSTPQEQIQQPAQNPNIGYDFKQFIQPQQQPQVSVQPVQTPPQTQPEPVQQFSAQQSNLAQNPFLATPPTQETPIGEQAISTSPEESSPQPDWLTPKIYKGQSLG